jgi:hypothetical protein
MVKWQLVQMFVSAALLIGCSHHTNSSSVALGTGDKMSPIISMVSIDALKRFREKQINLDCFDVHTTSDSKSILISFVPNGKTGHDDGIIIVETDSGRTHCGSGIAYEFDRSGNFLREYLDRQ